MSEDRRHWQKILLREWRHCEDQDYALELFVLISPERVAWWMPALAYILAAAFYGALGGLWVGLFLLRGESGGSGTLPQWFWAVVAPFVSKGMNVGGAVGMALGLWAGWRSTWGKFLNQEIELLLSSLYILCVALFIELCFGLLGVLFGELSDALFTGLLFLLLPLLIGMFFVLKTIPKGPLSESPQPLRGPLLFSLSFFRWRSRPLAVEVEAALRAVASDSWTELLHHLDVIKGSRHGPTPWIAQLSGETWQERFLARHVLAALGGVAVEPLRTHNSSTARWLLKSIAAETSRQLGSRAASLLCPRCFARCQQHRAPLKGGAIAYYGCRLCRQSVEWLEAREVVAVLDSQMTLPWRQRDGRLYVDGLTRGAPFDCDRVAIVDATDDAVERFCMQVGNDTDDYRRPRYRTMPYEVGCPLSENTRRILQHTFGDA